MVFQSRDEQKTIQESLFDATIKSLLHERKEDGCQTPHEDQEKEGGGTLLGGGGDNTSLEGGATSVSRQQWLTGGVGIGVQDQQSLDTGFSTVAWGESVDPGTFAAIGNVSSVNPWS